MAIAELSELADAKAAENAFIPDLPLLLLMDDPNFTKDPLIESKDVVLNDLGLLCSNGSTVYILTCASARSSQKSNATRTSFTQHSIWQVEQPAGTISSLSNARKTMENAEIGQGQGRRPGWRNAQQL